MPESHVMLRFQTLQEGVYGADGSLRESVDMAVTDAAAETEDLTKARIVAALNNGMGALQLSDTNSTVMMGAQNEIASRIQSSVEQYARSNGKIRTVRAQQSVMVNGQTINLPELLEVKFDSADWAQWAYMAARYLVFKPRRADWVPPSEEPIGIPDDATIAVFADWGSGMYGAPVISARIEAMDVCDVVLHLGDTYYAGAADEISRRLVSNWPMRAGKGTIHRTLNGNHEMYSGATAYFAALHAPPFADQRSSCFGLQNRNWLLLGLDTSFTYGDKHGDMDADQVAWVNRMVANAGSRKVLLFSHHQIYSHFDNVGTQLQASLGLLLARGAIYGWYFGHEHRLVIFDEHPDWGLKARCMGHGGFPEFRNPSLPGFEQQESQWIPLPAAKNVPAAQLWDGPNLYINDDPQDPVKYIPHGYLVLNFEANGMVSETFLDPAGKPVRAKAVL